MKKAASVEFRNVTKIYGTATAVDSVSFTVQPGNLATLLGPSGCGKTTTLRMIAGLEMVTSGQVFIGEQEVTGLSASHRDVSMVFQSYALFPHMTVNQNVGYGLKMSGTPKADIQAKVDEGLEMVGLSGFGERLPSELSGGQQQRVAVARAMVLEPQVLLFDEPLSNLDAKLRRKVREEIREIQQTIGCTTVYVTHDQEEALAVSDRIIVMKNAKIAQEGAPRDLYEAPMDLFVADFIGDSNLVKGELKRVDGPSAFVDIAGLDYELPHHDLKPGEVDISIRPQAINLSSASSDDGIKGEITKSSYLGSHMEYSVDCALGELFVIDPHIDQAKPKGTAVGVSFHKRGVSLVQA